MTFILCFDPIIPFLKSNSAYGYDLDGKRIITTPFADDFCLITHNKRTQRLLNQIDRHIESMGLCLKPSKCRSLSFCSGKFDDLAFMVGEDDVLSVENDIHKFLGSVITKNLSSSEGHLYISNKLENRLYLKK